MKKELSGSKRKSQPWIINETKFLNREKIRKLRTIVNKSKAAAIKSNKKVAVRNWFMIELGLYTGLRVEEMIRLKSSDLFLQDRSFLIVRKGKGSKSRTVYFPDAFTKICRFYLKWKNKTLHHSDYLFIKTSGKKLTKRALQKSFKNCIRMAGLESYYSIHCLRHTYGTFLYKSSRHNLRIVQEQMGHSSIKTTQVYAGVMNEDVKNAIEKLYRS